MAMILINKKEIEENGEVFIIETYQSNKTGKESVVKYPKSSDVPEEPVTPEPTQLDRIENNLALLTEDAAEYKAFYEAAKEILPEGSEA
jgi:hypothetical protein